MDVVTTPPAGTRPRVTGEREQEILRAAFDVLREVGYDVEDVSALVAGAAKQQRLLACAPIPVDSALLGRVVTESM